MRARLSVLLVLLSLTLGCWNRLELERRAIILGIGVDKVGEEIQLTAQIVKPAAVKGPGETGGEGKPFWVTTGTGRTLLAAVKDMATGSGRELLFSHMRVIVVGEDLARAGIGPVLDFFDRAAEGRRRTWLLVSKGEAKEILETNMELQKVSVEALTDLLKARTDHSEAPGIDIQQFQRFRSTPGRAPVAGWVYTAPSKEKGGPNRLHLRNSAIFRADKLIDYLDLTETRGLLWLTGQFKGGVTEIPCPDEDSKIFALENTRSESKLKVVKGDNGLPKLIATVFTEGNLSEAPECGDLTDPGFIKSLEQHQAEIIRTEIEATLSKARDLHADFLGFGEMIYRRFPMQWSRLEPDWEQTFPKLEVQIEVNAKIRRIGQTNEPAPVQSEIRTFRFTHAVPLAGPTYSQPAYPGQVIVPR